VEFSITGAAPARAKTGCLVLGVHADAAGAKRAGAGLQLARAARGADRAAGGTLARVLAQGDLAAKAGATLLLRRVEGLAAERVLLVALGERAAYGVPAFREAVRGAGLALRPLGAQDAVFCLPDFAPRGRGLPWAVRNATLGLREAFYRFDQLKTEKTPPAPSLARVALSTADAAGAGKAARAAQRALGEAIATADGADLARTLGNLPPNVCTPAYLADEARKLGRRFGIKVQVLERRDMERLGMGALLSVTRGSHQPPKLIVLRYAGAGAARKPLVLVGKGITFDTGGISLKPAAEMDEMKYDMSGAASVLGAIHALAAMRAPVHVAGVIPASRTCPAARPRARGTSSRRFPARRSRSSTPTPRAASSCATRSPMPRAWSPRRWWTSPRSPGPA